MININHEKVERFYDYLDEASLIIYNRMKLDYLDCFLYAVDYILVNEKRLNKLEQPVMDELGNAYKKIADESFNKEEIRKAFQLLLLKTFKHLQFNMSDITPDSIGLLFAYFTDLFFKAGSKINVLDATVGCGNLLFSMINNSNRDFDKIYGIDINSPYIDIAYHLADLLEYEVEFFNQNNLDMMLVSPSDLIICDLPVDEEKDINKLEIVTAKNNVKYKPYLMIDNFMKYGKDGCYFIYLIPNDFFVHTYNELMKDIILKNTYIQAIIELPKDMFTDAKYQKSILILRKKGEKVKINKEILMLSFPSFKETEKVKTSIDKINQWFSHSTKA